MSINIFKKRIKNLNLNLLIQQITHILINQDHMGTLICSENFLFYITSILISLYKQKYLLKFNSSDHMGLLKDFGELYNYQNSRQYQKKFKEIAAKQFLYVYKRHQEKSTSNSKILWGDEIQGHRLIINNETKNYQLSFTPLPKLEIPLTLQYGKWMFQMIPQKPHETRFNYYPIIQNFRERAKLLNQNENQIFLTIPNIPFLGTTSQKLKKQNKYINQITNSLFIDDKHISDHARFYSLTKHIRERRGKKVDIRVPIYEDKFTKMQSSEYQPYPGFIYMDAMAFGMGMACLQSTFSMKNINQARYTYDQMHVLSPLFLALTAGTPIFKGKLSKWDVRWKIIESSVDDRTEQQFDQKSEKYQPKSRYSSVSYFIGNHKNSKSIYNDQKITINKQVVKFIKQYQSQFDVEIDQILLIHLGILLSRDFLVSYEKFLKMDEKENILFEMINSTNWNSVRFKIPTDDQIGWRVEFRTMEIQLTADENAAYSLLSFFMIQILNEIPDINFYIPISKINENFQRAHEQNSILKQKFYFRINIFQDSEPIIQELTLQEIFFGNQNLKFTGIFHIYKALLISKMTQEQNKKQIQDSLAIFESIQKFVEQKVTGKRPTLAQWMRSFVNNHPAYKFDSLVTQQINNDLIDTLIGISKGKIQDKAFNKIFQI